MVDIDFAIGFIAGEGHFGVTKNYQWKPYVCPRFSIQVHERDTELLKEIQNEVFEGVGRFSERGDRPHVQWEVKTKEDVVYLRDKIEAYAPDIWSKSDKFENFNIWKQIVEIHAGEQTTTTEERIEIAELAKNLNKDAGHNNVDWDEFIERLEDYE